MLYIFLHPSYNDLNPDNLDLISLRNHGLVLL
eukprot:UN08354